jgi:predicted phosphodiesterase
MKILIIADSNDFTWSGGNEHADVLIACGDTCDQLILQAAEACGCSRAFAVKGNHDFASPFPPPIIDLHLHVEEFGNLRFGGLNGSWKYKKRGDFLYEQSEVDGFMQTFPPVDIFVSHNSPRDVHDKNDNVHTGFDGLLTYVRNHQPSLLIHGHQHTDKETIVDGTRVLGVYGYRWIKV